MIHHGFFMGSFNFPSSSGVNTVAPQGQGHEELQEVEHVRNVFPETWLWTNASVRYDACQSDRCDILLLDMGSGDCFAISAD